MENPEVSGRIQMKRFIPVEIFRKKVIPFEVPKYLFPVLTETTEIFCTICLDYQCQASCREKVKIFSVFCKWCNSESRSCFRCPKKYSTIWRKFFTEISVQMVSTPKAGVPEWGTRLSQLSCGFRATFLNTLSPLSWSLEVARLKWIEKVGPRDLVILGVFFSGDILPFT